MLRQRKTKNNRKQEPGSVNYDKRHTFRLPRALGIDACWVNKNKRYDGKIQNS